MPLPSSGVGWSRLSRAARLDASGPSRASSRRSAADNAPPRVLSTAPAQRCCSSAERASSSPSRAPSSSTFGWIYDLRHTATVLRRRAATCAITCLAAPGARSPAQAARVNSSPITLPCQVRKSFAVTCVPAIPLR